MMKLRLRLMTRNCFGGAFSISRVPTLLGVFCDDELPSLGGVRAAGERRRWACVARHVLAIVLSISATLQILNIFSCKYRCRYSLDLELQFAAKHINHNVISRYCPHDNCALTVCPSTWCRRKCCALNYRRSASVVQEMVKIIVES